MKQINISRYSDPEHEAFFEDFKKSLIEHAQLNGQQHGAMNQPTTLLEFKVRGLNAIKEKIQGAIEFNRQKYQPVSGLVLVRQIELAAAKKIAALVSGISNDDHELKDLQHKMDVLVKPDHKKRILRNVLYGGVIIMALSETSIVRQTLGLILPASTALNCALAAGIVLGMGSHIGGGFVRKSKNRIEFILRTAAVMTPAVILFTILGHMRAEAYNTPINLYSEAAYLQSTPTPVSSFDISVVSIIFFLSALLFSCWAHKTKEEKDIDSAYDELQQKINKVNDEKEKKNNAIKVIEEDKQKQLAEATIKWEYASGFEQRLVALAGETAEGYKEYNLRHRTDNSIPACFGEPVDFAFTLFFDRSKNK